MFMKCRLIKITAKDSSGPTYERFLPVGLEREDLVSASGIEPHGLRGHESLERFGIEILIRPETRNETPFQVAIAPIIHLARDRNTPKRYRYLRTPGIS